MDSSIDCLICDDFLFAVKLERGHEYHSHCFKKYLIDCNKLECYINISNMFDYVISVTIKLVSLAKKKILYN